MARTFYASAKKAILDGGIAHLADSIKVVLIDLADYTPNFATHAFLSDVPAGARVGTPQTITGKSTTAGVFDGSDVTFPSVTGDPSEALLYFKDTGVEGSSQLIFLDDGKQTVTCAAAAAGGATSLQVDPLQAPLASGAALAFGGVTATLTAPAAAGARSLAVSALSGAIAAGASAEGSIQGVGLPVTPNGGNITVAFDNGGSGIYRLS